MDLSWGTIASRKFATIVGLITSNGKWGRNVMAAEWTHHVSYEPGLIIVNIHPSDATAENILGTKEFGVNLASEDQNAVASVAGNFTGKEVDKIAVLKELGAEFYSAKKINVLMIKGAVLNVECKVVEHKKLGDHVMFVGQAVEVSVDENLKPILYYRGKYWRIGENVPKPEKEVLDKINHIATKYKKHSGDGWSSKRLML